MRRLDEWCDEATFVDWEQAGADLPDWRASYGRLGPTVRRRASRSLRPHITPETSRAGGHFLTARLAERLPVWASARRARLSLRNGWPGSRPFEMSGSMSFRDRNVTMTGSSALLAMDSPGGQDANAVYRWAAARETAPELQRQADKLAADSVRCLIGSACGRGRARSTWGAAHAGFLTCWPAGCHPAAGSWASTLTRYIRPWRPSSSPIGRSDVVRIVTADARHTGLRSGSIQPGPCPYLCESTSRATVVVAEIVQPGQAEGCRVAVAEPDTEHALCYPPHPAFDRIVRSSRWPSAATAPIWQWPPGMDCSARRADGHRAGGSRTQMYPPGNSRRTVRLAGAQHAPVYRAAGTG